MSLSLCADGLAVGVSTKTHYSFNGPLDQGGYVTVSSFMDMSRRSEQHGWIPAKASTWDAEHDLFAPPLSPRSPEMTKSPFSVLQPLLTKARSDKRHGARGTKQDRVFPHHRVHSVSPGTVNGGRQSRHRVAASYQINIALPPHLDMS